MRVILGVKRSDRVTIEELLKRTCQISVQDIAFRALAAESWRHMNSNDEHLSKRFKKFNSAHNTRASKNSLLVNSRLGAATFDNNLIRLWNRSDSAGLRRAINIKEAKRWAKERGTK